MITTKNLKEKERIIKKGETRQIDVDYEIKSIIIISLILINKSLNPWGLEFNSLTLKYLTSVKSVVKVQHGTWQQVQIPTECIHVHFAIIT